MHLLEEFEKKNIGFGLTINIFTKVMLCNIILKIIINFIIYIEISMIYIDIIGLLSCFDCTNFKASLVIKIINFNVI